MKNLITTIFAGLLATSLCQAQLVTSMPINEVSAPAQNAVAKPVPQNVTPSSKGIFESSTFERTTDKIFDVNKDSFDFENGTLHWKGRTFAIGDSRLVKARFEKYLSTPVDVVNFAAYQSIINEIYALLMASNDRLDMQDLRVPWSKLFDAAEYDIDGGSSMTIANLVYLSWRMKDEFRMQKELAVDQNRVVDSMRKQYVGATSFMEYANDKIKKANSKNATQQRTEGTSEIAMLSMKLAEETTELGVKKAATTALGAKAIFQFQSHVITFLLERKFQQAQLSAMFYRHIYRGSVQDIQVGKEKLQSLLDIKNYVPTMGMFESMALEARNDVRSGMAAVTALYDSGERYNALQRLMETFVLGEFDPVLLVFNEKKKAVLREIYRKTSTIKSLADDRDWEGVEEVIAEIKELATDFPERQILAKVRAAKNASNNYVMAAKGSAALGKLDDVKANLAEAAKLWPLNPNIEKFNSELIEMTTGVPVFQRKFDDFIAAKNYRGIYAQAQEFAFVLQKDSTRINSLKEITERVAKIDAYIKQAESLVKQGNGYIAWDLVEMAKLLDPDDPELNKLIGRIAPSVSDYSRIIEKARKAEAEKKYAAALNLFLAAQKLHQTSQVCREAIERLAPLYIK